MDLLPVVAEAALWICATLIVYTYALYPALIWCLARHFGRPSAPPPDGSEEWPPVSLVIAAHNEEAVIEERLLNALEMNYPPGRIEVVVGSDGSTDTTAAIVRRFASRGVRLLDYAQRRGKASVLNSLMPELTGEIVLLSDANTFIEPGALRPLVRWFRDPRVGVVCGEVVLSDPTTGRNVDSLYWRYETFLKRHEGRLGALLGANGPIYAIRRDLYVPIPEGTIVDDFVIPLLAKLRTGCAIVYDEEATAREETPSDVGSEFFRRCRIGAGGFQAIGMLGGLLDPRQGWVAFTFLSHKVLRWLCPFFMIVVFASNLVLLGHSSFYWYTLFGQMGFYLVSFLVAFVPARFVWLKPLRLTTMFTSMNAALLIGFWRWLRGRQGGMWRRTTRAAEVDGGGR